MWIILTIIAIAGIAWLVFTISSDSSDLEGISVLEKFRFLASRLDEDLFEEDAEIAIVDKWTFKMKDKSAPHNITITYSAGGLLITWRYNDGHREATYRKRFEKARNLSIIEQSKIAEFMCINIAIELRKAGII